MVVHRSSGEEQTNISLPLSQIADMSVDENDGKKDIVIKRIGKEDITLTISEVDSITWRPSFAYENAEVFALNESTLTAKAQKCNVTFDATAIDSDVDLCVRNATLTPKVIDGTARGMAIDLSLSNGVHDLAGTAEISIPYEVGGNEKVHAAYFNEETGEWEPVYFKHDKENGNVIITTDHLSTYSIFTTYNEGTRQEYLDLFWEECPEIYTLNEATKILLDIVSSDDPDKQMINEFKDEMSFWQGVGLDGFYNLITSVTDPLLNFKPDAIDNAVTAMGYLGTAISIVNVAGADIKGDDVGVASGTLSTILNFATGQMAAAIGTPIMSASMGCVAFIGVALNKFGTMVQDSKLELFRGAYNYYYSMEGYNDLNPQSRWKEDGKHGYYRTATDWYNYFYPAFEKGMSKERLDAYIEQSVRVYCDRFWEDNNDVRTLAYAHAKTQGLSTYMNDTEALRKQISDEHFAQLMNGTLVSVFTAIRNNLKVQANKRYQKAAKDVAEMMNTKLAFQFKDSGRKEGEKSRYAGLKVAFSEIPSTIDNPEKWQTTVNDDGWAGLGWFTEYALIKHKAKGRITLYDYKDVEWKTFDFQIPANTGKVIIDFDLATGGTEVEVPQLKDLKLEYDPDKVDTYYTWAGTIDDGHGGRRYHDEGGPNTFVKLDNAFNKNSHFQTEIEKFFKCHDFITVDAQGNIKIGDDIAGRFEGEKGTGKFTINSTHPWNEKTIQQFLAGLKTTEDEDLDAMVFLNWLNGTIAHKIDCEFTLTRNTEGEGYIVEYTGKGTYTFKANIVDRIENVNFDTTNLTGERFAAVTLDDISTREIEAEGTVTLQYTTKLR